MLGRNTCCLLACISIKCTHLDPFLFFERFRPFFLENISKFLETVADFLHIQHRISVSDCSSKEYGKVEEGQYLCKALQPAQASMLLLSCFAVSLLEDLSIKHGHWNIRPRLPDHYLCWCYISYICIYSVQGFFLFIFFFTNSAGSIILHRRHWCVILSVCSWCECGVARSRSPCCHPDGSACGSAALARVWGAAAAAGAPGTQTEAADPEAAAHRRVPAAARAALPPARSPAAGAH